MARGSPAYADTELCPGKRTLGGRLRLRRAPATTEHAFAVDLGEHAIELSDEHVEVRWLHYEEAVTLLRFDSNRIALWELHERLYPAVRCKRTAFDTKHAGRCACSPVVP